MGHILQVSEAVQSALLWGRPVVALESTVIAHGLPYPKNLETARAMEAMVRDRGATPATIAVLGGRLHVGLADAQLDLLATSEGIRKVSRRDLSIAVARGLDGATTVAATATVAAWAGIEVLATGGIGGVHRGPVPDVSNDLPTLASVPIAVVCSGAKSILDLRATVEWLETAGVPIIGYQCDEFPAFYTRKSGLPIDVRVDSPDGVAAIVRASQQMGLPGAILVTVPIPIDAELPADRVRAMVEPALAAAAGQQIEGGASTPFLLRWIAQKTKGASLRANVALLQNNAAVAAEIAVALASSDQPTGNEAARGPDTPTEAQA